MRPKEFDPVIALGRAMEVFWERGYVDTSIEDLVARTGVSRYGLYGEFKNKRGLFLASLRLYLSQVVDEVFGAVEAPNAAWPEITGYFAELMEAARDNTHPRGCLMCVAGSEAAPFDPKVAAIVRTLQERMRRGFRNALVNARAAGQIRADTDPVAAADVLACTAQAIGFLSRTPMDRDAMERFVENAFSTLK